MLRRSGKPVALAVNKCDSIGYDNPDLYEFYNLGLGDPHPVSALHGNGSGDLLDACVALFPNKDGEYDEEDSIKLAILGRPNVGKSSIVNRMLGENRVIVSDIAGTTRDAVDTPLKNAQGNYVLIDTAGLRKKSKVTDQIEYYSVLRAKMAIERSDVCLIVLDATSGITEQDVKVAGMVHESGKPSVVAVNKWDIREKDTGTAAKQTEIIKNELAFMSYAPVIFVSALTGQRVAKIFELVNLVSEQSKTRIPTGRLNNILADAQMRVQPPSDKGRRLKVYYVTQTGIEPPNLVFFVNDSKLFHFSYRRYLENRIREAFSLDATPVRVTVRQKGDQEPD
jgi:GTP-binding protein